MEGEIVPGPHAMCGDQGGTVEEGEKGNENEGSISIKERG